MRFKHLLHGVHLERHNLSNLWLGERQEHDGLVDAVKKLRAYGLLQHVHDLGLGVGDDMVAVVGRHACKLGLYVLASEVRGHDDDGVLEVDGATLVVGQTAVVEHLKQDVEHVGVSLLYLVEEHHRVGFAAHSLSELSTLVVADVSWRRTDETADAELFLIFAHVDARHHGLVVEQILGQRLCQLRLANARGAEEDERSDRTLRVLQSGSGAAHGIAHSLYGLVLANDTFVELLLQVQQFLALALHHSGDRYSSPAAHHLGNVVGGDLLADHGVAALRVAQLGLNVLDVLFESLQLAVAYLSHALIVAFAFSPLSLKL